MSKRKKHEEDLPAIVKDLKAQGISVKVKDVGHNYQKRIQDGCKQMVHSIGTTLCQKRKEIGFSQEKIRSITGLTAKQIIDIEKGRTNYTVESLIAYSLAIGYSLNLQQTFTVISKGNFK
jgi:DNA-binding XRE family transcriptional regulator